MALNLAVGWQLCKLTNRSQLWLAIGKGPTSPFLNMDIDPSWPEINDHIFFVDGVVAMWDRLLEVVAKQGISVNDIAKPNIQALRPRKVPEKVTASRIRISMTKADRAKGQMVIVPIFLEGCEPAMGSSLLTLNHPGVATVDWFLRQRDPDEVSLEFLRKCLAVEFREESFLRRLDPHFLVELKIAAEKLVGILPLEDAECG